MLSFNCKFLRIILRGESNIEQEVGETTDKGVNNQSQQKLLLVYRVCFLTFPTEIGEDCSSGVEENYRSKKYYILWEHDYDVLNEFQLIIYI